MYIYILCTFIFACVHIQRIQTAITSEQASSRCGDIHIYIHINIYIYIYVYIYMCACIYMYIHVGVFNTYRRQQLVSSVSLRWGEGDQGT